MNILMKFGGLNPFLIRATFERNLARMLSAAECLNPFLIRATFERLA